ncbi:MAG: hydroxymethylglutaryl-CoA reductase [Desulfobulbaceae bacterium]|nr:hydroxymethylglutaryl-CoA reductase [Desulfobulbaceae bacterium]
MPQSLFRSRLISQRIAHEVEVADFKERLRPKGPQEKPLPKRVPGGNDFSVEGLHRRREFLAAQGITTATLGGGAPIPAPEDVKGNIENFLGFCQVPVGVVGPLRINGLSANGDFFIPLATSEGALVASYHRGANAISQAGGASALCLTESVSRAPCFCFASLVETALFLNWLYTRVESFPEIIKGATSHGELIDIRTSVNGATVYLIFEYTTGDAAGQNMVTAATEALCRTIIADAPVKPRHWYLEGNLSGDKKASMLSFLGARGKKVVAEALLPEDIVHHYLHSTPAEMARYCQISTLGGIQSGQIGVQGHFANAMAALFIACGQDAACVAEAAIGITAMEVTDQGALAVSVSLPNLTVGTIGGGTHLPTARECLGMLDCYGVGKARKFAEICACLAMAGEVSIIAALAAGDFGQAHATYRHKA